VVVWYSVCLSYSDFMKERNIVLFLSDINFSSIVLVLER